MQNVNVKINCGGYEVELPVDKQLYKAIYKKGAKDTMVKVTEAIDKINSAADIDMSIYTTGYLHAINDICIALLEVNKGGDNDGI